MQKLKSKHINDTMSDSMSIDSRPPVGAGNEPTDYPTFPVHANGHTFQYAAISGSSSGDYGFSSDPATKKPFCALIHGLNNPVVRQWLTVTGMVIESHIYQGPGTSVVKLRTWDSAHDKLYKEVIVYPGPLIEFRHCPDLPVYFRNYLN